MSKRKAVPKNTNDLNEVRWAKELNRYLSNTPPIVINEVIDVEYLAEFLYERREIPLTKENLELFYVNVHDCFKLDRVLDEYIDAEIQRIYEIIKEPCEDCNEIICNC